MIPIAKLFDLSLREDKELLEGIWQCNWLPEIAPMVNDLQHWLKRFRNYTNFPVLFETHEIITRVKSELEKLEIFSCKSFYPALSSLNYVNTSPTFVADDLACRILWLPMHFELSEVEQKMLARNILRHG